jgi:hypothetical protein
MFLNEIAENLVESAAVDTEGPRGHPDHHWEDSRTRTQSAPPRL